MESTAAAIGGARRRTRVDAFFVALGGVVAVGAALRFGNLGSQSYWYDESLTVALVRAPSGARSLGIDSQAEPPLYFLLAWPWARAFGDSEVGLRSLSALFGVLTIPVAYAAASTLLNRRVGLVTSAAAALGPLPIPFPPGGTADG